MNRVRTERNPCLIPGCVLLLGLAVGLLILPGLEAQDRGNPWATPEQRAPAPGMRPGADGRFAPRDYDPVNERRRRDSRGWDSQEPGFSTYQQYPSTGLLTAPDSRGYGLEDPTVGRGWSPGFQGAPGLGYPSLSPYGAYPGSGMLLPGTGLLTPGLLSPLYGSSLGTVPMYGLSF